MSAPAAAQESDQYLLPRVAAGDEAAFRTLYRRHTPRLRALTGRLLGGHVADTEDVLQEAWIRAVTRLSTFRGDSAFGTWLGGIGINTALELIRRKRPRVMVELSDTTPAPSTDNAARIDLDDALARLSDAHRMIVVLHDVEGYTHEEIAVHLDIAVGTSKARLFRARRVLRSLLESHERVST